MFAILSYLGLALSFYLVGLSLLRLTSLKVSPIALSIPVIYLFFMLCLSVKLSVVFLLASALISLIWMAKKINLRSVLIFLGIALVLDLLICQYPIMGWDNRSIWFFHAKIFYLLHGREMLERFGRNEITFFSHSDYPKLQPFLSALFAFPYPEWREQIAKASLPLLWIPIFAETLAFKNLKIKALILFFILLLGNGGQLIGGMTDWLLACYVLIGFMIYHESEERWLDSIVYLSLPLLIKAEGLAMSTLGIAIILLLKSKLSLKDFIQSSLRASVILIVPGLGFLVWKIHCAHYDIHNYLTGDPGAALQRLTGRISDGGKSFWIFADGFGYYNKVIKNMVYVALIRRVIQWKRVTSFEIGALSFAGIYFVFLFLIYMATPFDLDWHLSTSVERTAFPIFLLSLVTLLIRDIEPAKKV